MKKHLNLIFVFILGFLVCMLYNQFGPKICRKNFNIPSTTFKKLDDEHYDMFKSLDEFHQHCKKHWDTEAKLFQEGKKRMPKSHKNIDESWKEHDDQHKKFIARIVQMKKDIVNHIEKYDKPHFHFGNLY